MSRGDKSKITDKLERKADRVAEGYEKKSLPDNKADIRVWSTDNNEGGGHNPDRVQVVGEALLPFTQGSRSHATRKPGSDGDDQ